MYVSLRRAGSVAQGGIGTPTLRVRLPLPAHAKNILDR